MAENKNKNKTMLETFIDTSNPLSTPPRIEQPKSVVNKALNNTKELLFGDYSKYIMEKSPVFSSTPAVSSSVISGLHQQYEMEQFKRDVEKQKQQEEESEKKKIPVPADMSSFIDMADIITNRTIMILASSGYKVTTADRDKIYKRVLQKMASNGMMPDKKEVKDISLLKLLANKGIISVPPVATNDVNEIIDSLDASDRQRFYNYKNYYQKQAEQLDRILFGSQQQNNVYLNILQDPRFQNTGSGYVIDM